MPLSEEELRLLEQMERALVEEDPKFASTLRGTSFKRAARRKAILAGVVFAVGIAVMMTGAVLNMIIVGIVGFVIMLASATYGLATWRGRAASSASPDTGEGEPHETTHEGLSVIDGGRAGRKPRNKQPKQPKQRHQSSGTFMERMEERWRQRRENGGF